MSRIDCLVDTSRGFGDPHNIYKCAAHLKCCKEFALPSCCESKPTEQIIYEQLSIWGSLFGFLFLLAFAIWLKRSDFYLMEGNSAKERIISLLRARRCKKEKIRRGANELLFKLKPPNRVHVGVEVERGPTQPPT